MVASQGRRAGIVDSQPATERGHRIRRRGAQIRPIWLLKSGAPKQVKILEGAEPLANAAGGFAFQPVGTLWVTTLNNTLLKFTPAQLNNLAKNPHPTPAATITSSAFGFILSCVFDSHVNLWIVNPLNNGVHEVSHAQLVAGTADITPAVTITDSTDLASPAFATFDKAGNLWISSEGNGKLVKIAASQLGTGGTRAPHVVITSSSLNAPGQLAIRQAWQSMGNECRQFNGSRIHFCPACRLGQPRGDGSPQ